jgi:hypothetical protein
MVDGPAIYGADLYAKSPLEKFVTNFGKSFSATDDELAKDTDRQSKASDLENKLIENRLKRQAMLDREQKIASGELNPDGTPVAKMQGDKSDPGSATGSSGGGSSGGGSSGGGGSGGGDESIGGVGGAENWETQHNNFAGMRIPGVNAGPNSGGFQSFDTPEQGVQAISKQLDRYASGATTGQKLTTLRGIINTWAPPSENDTSSLLNRATKIMGVGPDDQLDLSNPETKARLVEAMIRNEQGGNLHPNAAAAIPKVFGLPNWQPTAPSSSQTAAIGGNQAAPAAPTGDLPASVPPAPTGREAALGAPMPAAPALAPVSAAPAPAPAPAAASSPASGSAVTVTAPPSFNPPATSAPAPAPATPGTPTTQYVPQQQSPIVQLVPPPQQYALDPTNSGLFSGNTG